MTAISDFAAKQNAFNDQMDTAITGLTGDIQSLNDTIKQLQESPGTVTAQDQALLDTLTARAKAASDKLTALDALTAPATPGTPLPAGLAASFTDAASLTAAVAAYQSAGGTYGVKLDGAVVGNASFTPVIAYFTQAGTSVVSTTNATTPATNLPAGFVASYPDVASLNAAVHSYQSAGGTYGVNLDGNFIGNRALTPVIAYFTQAGSSVSTTPR